MMFLLGLISGVIGVFIGAFIYAKRQPRKVAQSLLQFELFNEEQYNKRIKEKLKRDFINEQDKG